VRVERRPPLAAIMIVLRSSVIAACVLSAFACSSSGGAERTAFGEDLPLPPEEKGFDPRTAPFVKKSGSVLVLEGKPFRFVSFNVPNYHVVEDPRPAGGPAWHRVSAWEQEDAARTVRLMGGRVIRIYVPSVEGGRANAGGPRHVRRGPDGELASDEELWSALDRGLAIAAAEGVRVIIPLVNEWPWFGGAREWARMAGARDFWNEPAARAAFKEYVAWLLSRTNTVTGLRYRDDPTILCWELGNEIQSASEDWMRDVAAHVKSLDGRHLVMDGGHRSLRKSLLDCPDIDVFTTHYADRTFARDAEACARRGKAFIYGEFDPESPEAVARVCAIGYLSKASGVLAWSLRFRADSGGFYFHDDFRDSDSLQFPGFDATRPSGEREIFFVMRAWAWKYRGYSAPPVAPPPEPRMLSASRGGEISFRGSTGATSHRIERSGQSDGPWEAVGEPLIDALPDPGSKPRKGAWPLFIDPEPSALMPWYRIVAMNEGGETASAPAMME